LSFRQQRILTLTADGWDVPGIATELGTTPERVSDEKYKAVRKLRAVLKVESHAT
jgi:DNA-binding NarL/FixJ family response regulator